jgi:hypothetical protein
MRASYFLTVFALRIWVLVGITLFLLSLSDFMFKDKHSFKQFASRVWFTLIWPISLVSKNGRKTLFGKFEGI